MFRFFGEVMHEMSTYTGYFAYCNIKCTGSAVNFNMKTVDMDGNIVMKWGNQTYFTTLLKPSRFVSDWNIRWTKFQSKLLCCFYRNQTCHDHWPRFPCKPLLGSVNRVSRYDRLHQKIVGASSTHKNYSPPYLPVE